MKYAVALTLSVLLGAGSARAVAQSGNAAVEIKITAEIEVVVKTADGREETKRVPAAKVPPGQAVIYTLNAKNTSTAKTMKNTPIPKLSFTV